MWFDCGMIFVEFVVTECVVAIVCGFAGLESRWLGCFGACFASVVLGLRFNCNC